MPRKVFKVKAHPRVTKHGRTRVRSHSSSRYSRPKVFSASPKNMRNFSRRAARLKKSSTKVAKQTSTKTVSRRPAKSQFGKQMPKRSAAQRRSDEKMDQALKQRNKTKVAGQTRTKTATNRKGGPNAARDPVWKRLGYKSAEDRAKHGPQNPFDQPRRMTEEDRAIRNERRRQRRARG